MYYGLDSLLDDFFNDYSPISGTKVPPVTIWEDKDGFTLEAEVPGYSLDDLKLKLEKEVLTISTSEKFDKELAKQEEHDDVVRHYCECDQKMSFSRSFQLPSRIDIDKVQAKLSKGILNIRIPKAEEAKPKMIDIK
ncbi:MAG: Hsp20/alpha crystallin family protein [Spirochaetia bacterium]|jgi:HSP20 family protein|nr:Hsp20/alpha crystallin family protein [Spirochaetia bacterium]